MHKHVITELFKSSQQRTFKPGQLDLVLDLGVGTASSTTDLAKNCYCVIGIDRDSELLQKALARLKNEQVKNAILIKGEVDDIDELFLENTFDYVNCYAAFHHFYEAKILLANRLEKPKTILNKIHYVLKPQGIFTLFDPVFTKDTRDKWEEVIREREEIQPEGDGQFYTVEEFYELLTSAHFAIDEIRYYRFKRYLNEWVKGAIKADNRPFSSAEEALKKKVESLFETDSVVAEQLEATLSGTEGWIFYYPIIDIKAIKK